MSDWAALPSSYTPWMKFSATIESPPLRALFLHPWSWILASIALLFIISGTVSSHTLPKPNIKDKTPRTVKELAHAVAVLKPLCSCDKCSPHLYHDGCSRKHHTLDLTRVARNRYGYKAMSVPKLLFLLKSCEAMHLTRCSISYFDKQPHQLNDHQLAAVDRFKALYTDWGSRLGRADAYRAVSKARAIEILQVYNDLFFFGAIPGFDFAWDFRVKGKGPIGRCTTEWNGRGFIQMHSLDWNHRAWVGNPEGRKLGRFSTLLHEALHAFLRPYTCKSSGCTTYRFNLGTEGHGRAWQLLAAKLEHVVPRLLGIEIDLNRFTGLKGHMFKYKQLPSGHDLECYNLRSY